MSNEPNPNDLLAPTPEEPRVRRRSRRKAPPAGRRLDYVDLPPTEAWQALGFPSLEAIWAYLRRHEVDGSVDLQGGAIGYRRGRRWVVRMPRTNPLTRSA